MRLHETSACTVKSYYQRAIRQCSSAKSLFDGVGGLFLICHCHGVPLVLVGVGVKNDAVCIVQYIAHIALQAVACQFDQCFLHGPILSEA